MTITNSLTSSSMSSSFDSNLIFQSSQQPTSSSSSLTANLDSLSSYQNRNQTALHKRAQQLRRWREIEENEKDLQTQKSRTPTKVCFSPTTLFLSACAQRDFEECERLLSLKELREAGGVNVSNCDGLTALHQACIDDNEPIVRWLLSKGANINCKDNEGWTPLHASANCGNLNIVKILVSNPQCDLFALNCDNELACDVAETKECEDYIRNRMARILKNGEQTTNRTRSSITISGDIDDDEEENDETEEVFKNLRQQELKAIERDLDAWIKSSNTIDIKCEIESTRDPLSGATIIHVCAAKGYNDALDKFLIVFSKRLDLDSFRDCDGYTALHAAAFWRQPETFETLLKYGANPDLLTEKTSDNIISSSVLELCKNDPKFIELIEVNKEKEKIAKESETQRKIFAKRQRETRRSTQGVKKEDLEKALKMMEISQNNSTGFTESGSTRTTDDNVNDNDSIKTTDEDTNLITQDDDDVENANLNGGNNNTNKPSSFPFKPPLPNRTMAVEPITNLSKSSSSTINDTNNNNNNGTTTTPNNAITPHANEPETPPPTVTMKISSTTPAEFARKRRIKRRATGIEDDSGHVLSPDVLSDTANPLASENIDAAFDVILSTPVSQVRSSRINRPVSNASSLSSLNSIKSNRETDDTTNISGASSINSLSSYVGGDTNNNNNSHSHQKSDIISKNTTNNSNDGGNNYRNVSNILNNNSSGGGGEIDAKESLSSITNNHNSNNITNISSDDIDYKKLCKQLLRENETLRRRIKELEEADKKREQEFGREKRALQRTISELEEELKSMNDIKADNMRLKDENAALIRVISKLSKN